MTINVERDFELIILKISGRIDTKTAPSLEKIVSGLQADTKELVFNISDLEYISSAGIRVMLGAYKKMNSNHGIMRIVKANETVRQIFEMTGLLQMLDRV